MQSWCACSPQSTFTMGVVARRYPDHTIHSQPLTSGWRTFTAWSAPGLAARANSRVGGICPGLFTRELGAGGACPSSLKSSLLHGTPPQWAIRNLAQTRSPHGMLHQRCVGGMEASMAPSGRSRQRVLQWRQMRPLTIQATVGVSLLQSVANPGGSPHPQGSRAVPVPVKNAPH